MTRPQDALGTEPIGKLLLRQSVPASIGILFMTVNLLVDTIFVGRWIGSLAVAALAVVTPIMFFVASVGFSIGIGGSSVISRALGSGNSEKAKSVVAQQVMMTVLLSGLILLIGLLFPDEILSLFGAKGKILEPARDFFYPVLLAAPLQALCSMSNSIIRAEHRAGFSMAAVIIASIGNIVLDIIFIKVFGWGIFGAALATALSLLGCFLFLLWYFLFRSELRPSISDFKPDGKLIGEISSLSATSFSRQGVITILSALLNNTLFQYGGAHAVTVYGIISRMLMFALFPVNGVTEGFMPIAGYNYGAEKFKRVRQSIKTAVLSAGALAIAIYGIVFLFASEIVRVFSDDPEVLRDTPSALRWVFAASPVIALQLIGAAYFQAAGKPLKALMLTLSKQGFFLIPLILILPRYFGIFGIWVAFPVADLLATLVTSIFLWRELRTKLKI